MIEQIVKLILSGLDFEGCRCALGIPDYGDDYLRFSGNYEQAEDMIPYEWFEDNRVIDRGNNRGSFKGELKGMGF